LASLDLRAGGASGLANPLNVLSDPASHVH
jgi:hypothetical protein